MAHLGLLNELQAKSNKKKKKKGLEQDLEINYTDCDVTYIYNTLQTSPFSRYYLLLDVRDSNAYNKSRIYQSIHLDLGQIDDMSTIKKLRDIPCNKPNNLKFIESKKIIIYDHNKTDTASNDKISKLKTLLINTQKIRNCRVLSDGFDAFYAKYPFCVITGDHKGMLPKYPHEIIENKLYLGDGQQATKADIVGALKITHIANISKEIKCAFADTIEYIDVEIQDLEDEDILCHIDKGLCICLHRSNIFVYKYATNTLLKWYSLLMMR
eukprot:1012000_1